MLFERNDIFKRIRILIQLSKNKSNMTNFDDKVLPENAKLILKNINDISINKLTLFLSLIDKRQLNEKEKFILSLYYSILIYHIRKHPDSILSRFYNTLKYGYPYFFSKVEIEISNICNRKCDYCPNALIKKRPNHIKREIFFKIIDELSALRYDGHVMFHGYGEPLIDNRLTEFIEYTRLKCRNCYIKINTNGDFLTYKIFKKLLLAGVDYFFITRHKGLSNNDNFDILNKVNEDEKLQFSVVYGVTADERVNRGGILWPPKVNYLHSECLRPLQGVVIDSYGRIVICCNDYKSSLILGDLNYESIMKIWKGKKYRFIRWALARGLRYEFSICKRCDDLGEYKNLILHCPEFKKLPFK